jgi:hypothetical protein
MLPSLTVSALLVPIPFSSWVVSHSAMESSAQPSWMPDPASDHRPYLLPPISDSTEGIPLPTESGTEREEFSFRQAWELTRSLESLPAQWHPVYRKWNRVLSQEHQLSMSAGGAHRYAGLEPITIRTPPAPPAPAVIETLLGTDQRRALRARLYRRLGIVRCTRTHRLARDPDSAWTTIGGLDRRVRWAQPS